MDNKGTLPTKILRQAASNSREVRLGLGEVEAMTDSLMQNSGQEVPFF
jgi:hypothetical protein